jgi:AcrR family transcriptional regulator
MLTQDPQAAVQVQSFSARQEELLDGLESLAQSERFGALGVGEIAARLNCSRSTLYAIAPSKEQLFLLLADRIMSRIEAAALAGAERGKSPAERLNGYLERTLEEIRQVRPPLQAEIQASAAARQRLAQFQATIISQMTVLIEAGIESGEFEAVNPVLVAELLDAAASRIQDPRVIAQSGLTTSEALAQIFQVVTRGLLK